MFCTINPSFILEMSFPMGSNFSYFFDHFLFFIGSFTSVCSLKIWYSYMFCHEHLLFVSIWCFWGVPNSAFPKLTSIHHFIPSHKQKFVPPSAYPTICLFTQVGNMILHWFHSWIWSVAYFFSPKYLESLLISSALFPHLCPSDITAYFIWSSSTGQ